MEYLILATIIIFVVMMITLIILMNQNRIKQELILKQVLVENEKNTNKELNELREKMTQELLLFQNQVTHSLKGDFNQLNESTIGRLSNIEARVNDGLVKGFESTHKAFTSMAEQLVKIDETQQSLRSLSENIHSLQSVLTDKKTRGTFGEVELYSILESAFGLNEQRYKKQYKLSNGTIADAVLLAPEPLGLITIDSKFPLENYNRMYDNSLSDVEHQKARAEFKKDVIKHMKNIVGKYIVSEETADFAYMFIPAEAVFAEIYGRFDEVVQLSYQMKVYLVSPTTLMAYITAIKAIYLGQQRNEKVELIQSEFIKLAKEFERFDTRFESVNKDFEKTYRDMQNISITSEKIIRRFKQIEAVELTEEEVISLQQESNGEE